MSCTDVLKARVTAEIKREVAARAEHELLTEAAWLKRLVLRELRSVDDATRPASPCRSQSARLHTGRSGGRSVRPVFVRLRSEDRLLLDARAEVRGMRPATYVSVLTRAHLRAVVPLPKEEFLALKRSIAELAAIGRNINQIARAANDGNRLPSSVREEFRAMLKICEALRDNTRSVLKANATSWSTGSGEAAL